MKAHYEISRERNQQLSVMRNINYAYHPHFHSHVEILIVKSGFCNVKHNGNSYQIKDGQIAFFNRFDIHSYHEQQFDGQNTAILIIPAKDSEWFLYNKK